MKGKIQRLRSDGRFFARTDGTDKKPPTRVQLLTDHLEGARDLVYAIGPPGPVTDSAAAAALVHDIGKCSFAFQKRLVNPRERAPHAPAGALFCDDAGQPELAFAVAGHHEGLRDYGYGAEIGGSTLCGRMAAWRTKNECLFGQYFGLPEPLGSVPHAALPADLAWADPAAMFRIRMIASRLIDADRLDAARWAERKNPCRTASEPLAVLSERIHAYAARTAEKAEPSPVNKARSEILNACIEAEALPPGLYSLSVPTGGGKTIASFCFGLGHAVRNTMQRLVYVAPFTSIIDQTADEMRRALGGRNVLEHHSNVELPEPKDEAAAYRLAAENWDFPVVLTTCVQFFESLFAAKASRIRKIHRLERSVIILDEVQSLPAAFLQACVFALSELVRACGATVVLCTATQPAIGDMFADGLLGHGAAEICPPGRFDPQPFMRTTVRREEKPLTVDALARHLAQSYQTLCIVNRRDTAAELTRAVRGLTGSAEGSARAADADSVFHLSTRMVPAHRTAVIDKIRRILEAHEPCVVISTSLIEAGVDISFKSVWREQTGMYSIAQAAGRCNRNGKDRPEDSPVHVFKLTPERRHYAEQDAAWADDILLRMTEEGLSLSEACAEYGSNLMNASGDDVTDREGILELMRSGTKPFRTIEKRFRLIDDNTVPVYVPWQDGEKAIAQLCAGERTSDLFRHAGRYAVNVAVYEMHALVNAGAVIAMDDGSFGILADTSLYSEDTGLAIGWPEGDVIFV